MGKVTRRGFVAALAGLTVARSVVNVLPVTAGDISRATFRHWQPDHTVIYSGHQLDALRYSIMTQMEATNPLLAAIKRKAAVDRGITS